ncbi:MAG: hypothetical protein ACYTFW_01860 [Planctomycetota bacterium]
MVRIHILWLVVLLCILALSVDHVCSQSIRSSRDANPKIVFGRFPPDFDLPRLHFETAADGNSVGVIDETNTITLSSFRGKKPVCLIMSSYT